VVNNYIVGNNNTIINNGVGRDYVASHTRGEIPRVRVQESSAANGRVVPDRLVRQGAETVVYRPKRPAPSLVAAHETAVARTRGEIARPTSTDSLATRRNMINSRQGTSEALAPGARPTSPRGGNGSTAVTRTETARPQIARGEVPTPVFAKPAPVRPEPDRSAEILRSRTSQESRVVRPSTGTGTIVRGGGTGSAPTSTPTARPVTAPSRSGVPRFEQSQPQTGGGVVRPTTPQTSGRPGTPSRSEIGRGSPVPGTPTPVPSTRPGAAPRTATPVAPAQGGGSTVQPVRPLNESGRPVTVLPSGRSQSAPNASVTAPQVARPSQPVAQSPAFARPAPTVVQQPAGPIVRPSVTTSTPSTVSPGASGPAWSRQSAIQRDNVSAAPQTIQRVAPPAQSPSLARPHTVQRSESFSRPSMPVQPAARPNVVQPQTVTPIQRPAMVRPQMSNPTVSAPVRNAPSVRTSPGPVQGGGYRSAPPSTPAARPVSPSSGRDSRGRSEIAGNENKYV
jgi:hypothetical protein